MVINTINNFLCHFFFVIADKSLERKAIREKMLLKILSSRPRVESKGTSSFPRKLFQRKATSRKNTMRNFLCRKFTLGSMSIRKPPKGKQSNRIQSNFSTFEMRFPSSLRRETILREEMLPKILFIYFTNPFSDPTSFPTLSKPPKGKQFAFKNFL